ncbi:MAG: serine protein kinase PrkA, partial [Desulfobacterales bacterium]
MEDIEKAIQSLNRSMIEQDQRSPTPFEEFLKVITARPTIAIRNVFQVFHDMVKTCVGEGIDEYHDDPESINFVSYDFSRLLVEGADHPFFADRLFANRFINHIEALRRGAQQNKIYIFDGPPGCGKSTFLNNLLRKFEEYTNTEDGSRFETVWRLDRKLFGGFTEHETMPFIEKLSQLMDNYVQNRDELSDNQNFPHSTRTQNKFFKEQNYPYLTEDYIEVPCPSHDHPILMVPKNYRRQFLDDLFKNDEFKWKLYT